MDNNRTRYREERTLVRSLRPLDGENRNAFKNRVNRLRIHFKNFNLDVSEICQWLMSIRPDAKKPDKETKSFWDFFLNPESFFDPTINNVDIIRLNLFKVITGRESEANLIRYNLPLLLYESIILLKKQEPSDTARRLFARLKKMEPVHVMILLKAAAEWVYARYQRLMDNHEYQYKVWHDEKSAWENKHPELTPEIREKYNSIFKELGRKQGVTIRKNPRICNWEKLEENKDNCGYNGKRIQFGDKWKAHSMLCIEYRNFLRDNKITGKRIGFFATHAYNYLKLRAHQPRLTKDEAFKRIFKSAPNGIYWFPKAWKNYLQFMNLNELNLIRKYNANLPHCLEFKGDKDCQYNKHTELCQEYKTLLLEKFTEDELKLEGLYREWRKQYLSGPSKPAFRYPSCSKLPTPKIFGKRFHEIDFENSIVRLRLDDMPDGEYLTFKFKPWPNDYQPQPEEAEISSVHVHFVGTRARVGFRFKIAHKQSRFKTSQDEIDELRSRKYPRQAQDADFLKAAREKLLQSFKGENPTKEIKIMAVDLGEYRGYISVYKGENIEISEPLSILKIDKLYDSLESAGVDKTDLAKYIKDHKGLIKEHVDSHLKVISEKANEITKHRPAGKKTGASNLKDYDLRSLTAHTGWMIRDWVRLNVSQIIRIAEKHEVDLIVLESLRGWKAPGYDEFDLRKKRWLAFFSYGRIRHKLKEKAVERGMMVVTVPYYKSSQICSKCGKEQENKGLWKKNKNERLFICDYPGCGHRDNSDANAAKVLAKIFWGEIVL